MYFYILTTNKRTQHEPLLYLPNDRRIQYKLGPERLTRLGNLNVLKAARESVFQ